MLKFEGKFAEGAYIRAYDFRPMRGRNDCFIEGTIIGVEHDMCSFYLVKCERDVFDGKEGILRVGDTIKVPMETSRDYDHRIIEL